MKIRIIIAKFLLLTLTSCAQAADSSSQQPAYTVRLKLGWRHGVQFIGYYVAQAHGFYDDEGLLVEIDPVVDPAETALLAELVANGDYDFSLSSAPLALAQANAVPVTTIATMIQLSPTSFFARTKSGIHTPGDFAGKRIGVTTDSTQLLLEHLLAKHDLALADVNLERVNFDMSPFLNGEFDIWVGYLTNEVVRARLSGLELVTFPLYEYDIRTTEDTLFTRRQIVDNNPDLAVRFLRASLRGWEWAIENPEDAVDVMIEQFPEFEAERDFHVASLDAYIPLLRPPGRHIGEIDCERWVSNAVFDNLESTDGLCTTEVFQLTIQ